MEQTLLSDGFSDGPFIGLGYKTPSHTGITDPKGRFYYRAGESVIFFLENIPLGSAKGAISLTVASLDSASDPHLFRSATVNRARFLLSFARDPGLKNGVTIDRYIGATIRKHISTLPLDSEIDSFTRSESLRAVFNELHLRFRGAAEVRNHLRRSLKGIKLLCDVQIPIRDGSWLGADVFLPIGGGPLPVLMNMSVYGRAFRIGVTRNHDDFQASEEREDEWHEGKTDEIPPFLKWSEAAFRLNASTWVSRGYVMIRVDHRGIGNTPGLVNPYSKQGALDYYDVIEWAASQPWSDGQVATFGASFHGTNSYIQQDCSRRLSKQLQLLRVMRIHTETCLIRGAYTSKDIASIGGKSWLASKEIQCPVLWTFLKDWRRTRGMVSSTMDRN